LAATVRGVQEGRTARWLGEQAPICGWNWLTEPPDRGNAYRNAYYHYCQLPKDHEGDHVCKDGATRPRPPEAPRRS